VIQTRAIRLRNSARYGFSVVVVAFQGDSGTDTLHQAYAEITNGLLTDTTFTGFDRKLIQGITRGESLHIYGSVALDNETPLLELQFDMTVDLGTADFYPTILDDFKTLHIDARPIQIPIAGGADGMEYANRRDQHHQARTQWQKSKSDQTAKTCRRIRLTASCRQRAACGPPTNTHFG
jgi:hypothetical protein